MSEFFKKLKHNKHGKICVEEVPEDLFCKAFFPFEKTFFKVSAQNFRHHLTWYHWLRKVRNVFHPIMIQNYDVKFVPVLHFLRWCYTWIALLSANQNRVIIYYIIKFILVHLASFWEPIYHSLTFSWVQLAFFTVSTHFNNWRGTQTERRRTDANRLIVKA